MSLAIATEVGYARIPSADHKHPTYHWRLTPGQAYRMTDTGHEITAVDEKTCKKAGYTFLLQWISGRTVALFEHEGTTYGQPIVPDPKEKGKKAKEIKPREALEIYAGRGPEVSDVRKPAEGREPVVRDRAKVGALVDVPARAPAHQRVAPGARGRDAAPRPVTDRKPAAARKQEDAEETIKSQEEPPAVVRRVKGQRRLKTPLSLFKP